MKKISLFFLGMGFAQFLFPMNQSGYPVQPKHLLSKEESDFVWSASQNDLERVRLLAAQVDPNVKKNGTTALHWAASRGYLGMVRFLLSGKANVDVRDFSRKTPLQWASGMGHKEIVAELLSNGADPDLPDINGDVALHWASYNKHNDIVQDLIQHEAEINVQNNQGITPLHTNLIVGNEKGTRLLLQNKALLLSDKQNRSPFFFTTWGNNFESFKALKEATSPPELFKLVNQRNKQGETPLHSAALSGNAQLVEELVACGADVNVSCYQKQRTPLHVCVRNIQGSLVHATTEDMYQDKMQKRLSPSRVVSVVQALKTNPDLNLTAVDEQGWTVYDYIAKNGSNIDEQSRERILKNL